ncbi:MAG: MAPEG family protein [Spirochaetae bacterium HGW-Spirochaetae-9]|nr:MAG: MAPEG family protein [Spirochaetae bacterium HGW-Spirochaetae-9]
MMLWKIYALTTLVLFLKMFAVAGVQGVNRIKNRTFVRPEDAAFFGGAAPAAAELPIVERAQNTLRNDLENIPLFLFLMLGYIQLQGPVLPLMIYATLFVSARIGHTLCYLTPRQPWRNLCYQLGLLMDFMLCGHLLWAVWRL